MSLCMLLAQCMPALLLTGMRWCAALPLPHMLFYIVCLHCQDSAFRHWGRHNTVILHAVTCSRVSCLLPLVCATECSAHNKPSNQKLECQDKNLTASCVCV
ncbi:hypothetical protein COO60DRAFT_1545548 [Scenedesmus sp. NREL 46B-D3]|nr:hypothetical protein COO60DRAFT_1545548 [Scenedesmus sp. NREL 46B-D3]